MRIAYTTPLLIALLACNSSPTPDNQAASQQVVLGSEVVNAGAADEGSAEEAPSSQPTSVPTASGEHAADDHEAEGTDRPGPMAPGETGHFGAAFSIQEEPMSLATALEQCADSGEPCLTTGTVDRVCQMSGCWFTVAAPDVDAVVRIRMQDYGFFVPRNAMGAEAIFEGTVELVDVPQAQAQHYADDEAAAGGEPREVDGPERTYAFTITGVELTAVEG